VDFEWDEIKNRRNIDIRGIDFSWASGIFLGPTLERTDARKDYGETRWIALGVVEGIELVVVYAWRGDRRRIISARRAHSRERASYRQIFPDIEGKPSE
jgi:uncharacterized protein